MIPDPTDEQFQQWSLLYGITAVKVTELTLGINEGCVAVYRETSVADRLMMARLSLIEDPNLFDPARMLVSSHLLYPNLEDFPDERLAIAELFPQIRQHGHGPLPHEQEQAFPESIKNDVANSRLAVAVLLQDPQYSTFYHDLILNIASVGGRFDVGVYLQLIRLPLAQLRDTAALLDATLGAIKVARLQTLNPNLKNYKQELTRLEIEFPSIFHALDVTITGAESEASDTPNQSNEDYISDVEL